MTSAKVGHSAPRKELLTLNLRWLSFRLSFLQPCSLVGLQAGCSEGGHGEPLEGGPWEVLGSETEVVVKGPPGS